MKRFFPLFLAVGSLFALLASCNLPGGSTSIPPAGGDEGTPPGSPLRDRCASRPASERGLSAVDRPTLRLPQLNDSHSFAG
jgi:hypothetical protein